ncbi:HpcH/HpaI aldolase/citrate lyase family protein [Colletotrichum godetiae]|uniref:HpcH/HpaI aldolase/citrate lyase family protein n=1 Tax=Colletotrichum godetiae TaxID=1209918 RepID=A0AAJ0EVQ0_9PEZI|nr:HpcH/HpaI aldolase/citrate lyase family protein [Colletotrichum godetiae]KAK1675533.1 HpcH/HpaI aldolase/citrate lyase family protein [Colletotrichum godetiae]
MANPGEEYKTASSQGMAAYAAPSLFQPHKARQAIRDAHAKKIPPLLCYYAGLSSIPITRYLAPMGFDAVWIDWEHTPCNTETMTTMVHEASFMSQGRTIPFVRLPGHDHATIGYALDAGASIVIPQVETVGQAKHAISAAKFGIAQNGTRSLPPFRLVPGLTDTPYDQRDLHKCLNDQAAIMIQIESEQAVKNLDEILIACGSDIDIVWFGTLDARVSMNLEAKMGGIGASEPEWVKVSKLFFDTIDEHDKPYAGFAFGGPPYGSPEVLKKAAERMSLVMISADVVHLGAMAKDLQQARELIGKTR